MSVRYPDIDITDPNEPVWTSGEPYGRLTALWQQNRLRRQQLPDQASHQELVEDGDNWAGSPQEQELEDNDKVSENE